MGRSRMAMGWLSAVALGCTLVLAVADQADVSELAATALEADPAGGVDFEAAYKSTQTHFKQVAGTLAGAAVIKTMRVSALPDCEAACRAGIPLRFTTRSIEGIVQTMNANRFSSTVLSESV